MEKLVMEKLSKFNPEDMNIMDYIIGRIVLYKQAKKARENLDQTVRNLVMGKSLMKDILACQQSTEEFFSSSLTNPLTRKWFSLGENGISAVDAMIEKAREMVRNTTSTEFGEIPPDSIINSSENVKTIICRLMDIRVVLDLVFDGLFEMLNEDYVGKVISYKAREQVRECWK